MILEIGLVVSLAVAVGLAFYKHGSLAAVEASAKKEAALIEAEAAKLEGDAKTTLSAIVARLKAL